MFIELIIIHWEKNHLICHLLPIFFHSILCALYFSLMWWFLCCWLLSQIEHSRFPVELNFTVLMVADKYLELIIFQYSLISKTTQWAWFCCSVGFWGLVFGVFFLWLRRNRSERIWWAKNCSSESGCRGCPSCRRVRQIGVCSSFMCKISNGFVCKFCLTPLLNARKGIYLPAAYCPGMLSLWISSPFRMSGGHPGVWQMTAAHRGLCVCNRAWAWAAEFVHQTNPIQLWAAREEIPGWWPAGEDKTLLSWPGSITCTMNWCQLQDTAGEN